MTSSPDLRRDRPGHLLRLGLPRDPQAAPHLIAYTVSAVVTILVTRGLLAATGYPQLGGGGLHVAHVLWGGLLMLASHVLLLSFAGPGARPLAAILGGAGFGLFIDEVGKFVTSDNDYFYRPAPSIMYVVFVLLIVGVHRLHRRRSHHPAEYLAGAVDYAVSGLAGGFTPQVRAKAQAELAKAGTSVFGAGEAAALLATIPADPYDLPNPVRRGSEAIRAAGLRLRRPVTGTVAIGLMAAHLVASLATAGTVIALAVVGSGPPGRGEWVSSGGVVLGALLSAGAAAAGLRRLRAGRLLAFRRFERAVWLSLLLTRVFQFGMSQSLTLVAIAADLAVLACVGAELHELRRGQVRPAA
jgi:hypothetical protein